MTTRASIFAIVAFGLIALVYLDDCQGLDASLAPRQLLGTKATNTSGTIKNSPLEPKNATSLPKRVHQRRRKIIRKKVSLPQASAKTVITNSTSVHHKTQKIAALLAAGASKNYTTTKLPTPSNSTMFRAVGKILKPPTQAGVTKVRTVAKVNDKTVPTPSIKVINSVTTSAPVPPMASIASSTSPLPCCCSNSSTTPATVLFERPTAKMLTLNSTAMVKHPQKHTRKRIIHRVDTRKVVQLSKSTTTAPILTTPIPIQTSTPRQKDLPISRDGFPPASGAIVNSPPKASTYPESDTILNASSKEYTKEELVNWLARERAKEQSSGLSRRQELQQRRLELMVGHQQLAARQLEHGSIGMAPFETLQRPMLTADLAGFHDFRYHGRRLKDRLAQLQMAQHIIQMPIVHANLNELAASSASESSSAFDERVPGEQLSKPAEMSDSRGNFII